MTLGPDSLQLMEDDSNEVSNTWGNEAGSSKEQVAMQGSPGSVYYAGNKE